MAVGQSWAAKALFPWFFKATACSSGVAISPSSFSGPGCAFLDHRNMRGVGTNG